MKKIMYTRPDGGVSIVIPAPKENIEAIRGPMTEKQYEAYVTEKSVPKDAINVKSILDSDLPADREFRDAWVDVTASPGPDVDLDKAKEIALEYLREVRADILVNKDIEVMKTLEEGGDTAALVTEKKALRAITDPLKALDTTGKVNDPATMAKIKEMKLALGEKKKKN